MRRHNCFGHRPSQSGHYDQQGRLIAETNTDGTAQRDYLWSDDLTPVAQIDTAGGTDQVSYLHTDHLMTPRLATDASQNISWRWEGQAFGESEAEELAATTINLRFPGQCTDRRTAPSLRS